MPTRTKRLFRRTGLSRRKNFMGVATPTAQAILRSAAFADYGNGLKDDFTNSNSTLLVNHNAFWRRPTTLTADNALDTEAEIQSNRLTATGTSAVTRYYAIPVTQLSYYVEASFYVSLLDSFVARVFARFEDVRDEDNSTGPAAISARLYSDGSGESWVGLSIWNAASDAYAIVAATSVTTGLAPAQTFRLGLLVQNDTYSCFFNGLLVGSGTVERYSQADPALRLPVFGHVGFEVPADGGSGRPALLDSFYSTGLPQGNLLAARQAVTFGHSANIWANQKPMTIKRTALEFAQDPYENAFSYSAGELASVSSNVWTKNTDIYASPLVNVTSAGRIRSADAGTSSNTHAYRLATPQPYRADYAVEADVYIAALPTTGSFGVAISARQQSGSTSRYRFVFNITNAGTINLYLYQTTVPISIRSAFITGATAGQTYRMRLQVNGSAIKTFLDDVEIASVTNATITNAGTAGVEFQNSSGSDTPSDSNLIQLDNVRVTNTKGQSIAIHSGWSISGSTSMTFGHSANLIKQPKKVTQALLTNSSSETLGTSFTTASVTLHANKLGLISLYSNSQNSGQNAVPTSVVMNGTLAFTLVDSVVTETSWGRLAIYRAVSPTDITGTVVITYANNQEVLIWELSEYDVDYSGTNGANAIVRTATAGPNTNVSSITTTLPSVDSTNNACYSAATAAYATLQNPTFTPEAGWSEISDREQDETSGNWTIALHTVWRDNGNDLTSTHTIALTSASSGGVIVELKAPVEGAISGAASFAFGQSATLRGTGRVSATNALVIGQSGTLRGVGSVGATNAMTFGQNGSLVEIISATSALAFGQSAALRGAGSISATNALTFGQNGSLVTVIDGVGTITFAQTAAINGVAAISAADSLTFNQSGALVTIIAANSALVFGSTADLTSGAASGEISGTTALTFSHSAELRSDLFAQGSTALTFAQSATISGTGDISATSALSFDQSADPSAIGLATASAAITIGQTGSIDGEAPLQGSVGLVFSSSATGVTIVPIEGSSAFFFGQAAAINASAPVEGSAALQIGSQATVEGAGILSGASGAAFSASGVAGYLADIAGTAPAAFSSSATIATISGIDGQTTISTGASAQVQGVGLLTATSAVQFSQNAVVSATLSATGNAAIQFNQSGLLGAIYPLAAIVSVSIDQVGSINAIAALAGQLQTTFTASAQAISFGAISANVGITFDATASIGTLTYMEGAAQFSFDANGDLIFVSEINGAADFNFATTGDLRNAVYIPFDVRMYEVEAAGRVYKVSADNRVYVVKPSKRTVRVA